MASALISLGRSIRQLRICVLLLIFTLSLQVNAYDVRKLLPEEARATIKPDEDYPVIIIVKSGSESSFEGKLRSYTEPVFGTKIHSARLAIINGFAVRAPSRNFEALVGCPEVVAIWIIPEVIFGPYVNVIKAIESSILENPDGGPINISLGPPPSLLPMAYHADEPMNLATRAAFNAGNLVIVSVGNAGPKFDTLNPWALAPWVVGVGAASKDGADDHICDKLARSLCGKTGRAQSPSGKALANGGATFSAQSRDLSRKVVNGS